ncbi:signal peptidase 22kDa subunit [Leucosporidium creatinivorum]|uniref:Signal peptidase subunit 3 n=1 Tax=Leucosporidium creatinivorum TaxID=106004 RepID=A0A1Y2D496_9BASI|nr:signal peptidase 22kDa subunit [Leucosporidium creatinivorum]
MHTSFQRLNNISALATTVIITLLSLVSLTTFLIPANLDPGSLKVDHLNVLLGRSNYDRSAKAREFAFVKYDLVADMSPLFNWNTKQVFVYLVADYSTPKYPENRVVVWDRIIRGSKFAKINIADGKQKYEFKEITDSFKDVSATFSLHYQVQPWVGALTGGEVVRTEAIKLPPAQRRVHS